MENAEHPSVVKGNWKRCAFLFALLGALMLLLDRWFFPWLGEFSARANCTEIAGINGSVVLFAALFVGLPFSAFAFTVWLGFYSRKILRAGQLPLPDAWVCRDTVPQTGSKVRTRAYLGLATPLFGIAFLSWGVVTFQDFKQNVIDPGLEKHRKSCVVEDNNSLVPTPATARHVS